MNKKGFSLLEIAVGLAVISLFGIVIKFGASLIESSEVRTVQLK